MSLPYFLGHSTRPHETSPECPKRSRNSRGHWSETPADWSFRNLSSIYHRWRVSGTCKKKKKHLWFYKESNEKLYKSSYILLAALICNGKIGFFGTSNQQFIAKGWSTFVPSFSVFLGKGEHPMLVTPNESKIHQVCASTDWELT